VVITPKDRYELAFLLSSSILQLYKTPWLNDNWTRDEIYLLYALPEKALARNMYVSKSFPKSQITLLAQADPDLALIRNVSVFNLGLALLELTYGHRIEYYQSESDLRNGIRTAMTNMLIAQRLIGQIEEYEGKRYSDVVYRCIFVKSFTKGSLYHWSRYSMTLSSECHTRGIRVFRAPKPLDPSTAPFSLEGDRFESSNPSECNGKERYQMPRQEIHTL
jgi:hypothetical protein